VCACTSLHAVQELKWGVRKFLFIYFLSGFFSALFSAICIPRSIGVGASGALMGIMVRVLLLVTLPLPAVVVRLDFSMLATATS
jgi:membrane associated rhomboid family serine protease